MESYPIYETRFARKVRLELTRAQCSFPPMHSLHEGYAVIVEELEEFWHECKKKPAARNPEELLRELVQVAAMCQRTAEDLGLI